MNLISRFYLFLLILLSVLQLRAAHASQYEISLFRDYVYQFQIADQQYQRAASGSFEERMADQQRRAQAQSAKNIIQAPNTFQSMRASENESLFLEFSSSYQSASSGSLRETIFDVARRAASEGLKINSINEIQNAYDFKESLQMALTAEQKYQKASSGSLLEAVYNTIRTQGFDISKRKLQDYSQYSLIDFRQAESLFVYFEQQYQSASSGSKVEDFYNAGRRVIHARALDLFRFQVSSFGYGELISMQTEYEQKYQRASSGSLPESLYRAIRDQIRSKLLGQATPSQCEVREGANASGQVLYRVMIRSGAIIATVFSISEAQRIAATDLRCR